MGPAPKQIPCATIFQQSLYKKPNESGRQDSDGFAPTAPTGRHGTTLHGTGAMRRKRKTPVWKKQEIALAPTETGPSLGFKNTARASEQDQHSLMFVYPGSALFQDCSRTSLPKQLLGKRKLRATLLQKLTKCRKTPVWKKQELALAPTETGPSLGFKNTARASEQDRHSLMFVCPQSGFPSLPELLKNKSAQTTVGKTRVAGEATGPPCSRSSRSASSLVGGNARLHACSTKRRMLMLPSAHCMITCWRLSASVANAFDTMSKSLIPSRLHSDFTCLNCATRLAVPLRCVRYAITIP